MLQIAVINESTGDLVVQPVLLLRCHRSVGLAGA